MLSPSNKNPTKFKPKWCQTNLIFIVLIQTILCSFPGNVFIVTPFKRGPLIKKQGIEGMAFQANVQAFCLASTSGTVCGPEGSAQSHRHQATTSHLLLLDRIYSTKVDMHAIFSCHKG
jgi:hypothetical protein